MRTTDHAPFTLSNGKLIFATFVYSTLPTNSPDESSNSWRSEPLFRGADSAIFRSNIRERDAMTYFTLQVFQRDSHGVTLQLSKLLSDSHTEGGLVP
jgi:hypothetical protein